MPGNKSFLAATISGTRKGGRSSRLSTTPERNEKRGRKVSQMNSSANESFIDQGSTKIFKKDEEIACSRVKHFEKATDDEPTNSDRRIIFSTPIQTGGPGLRLDETPIKALNAISGISTNMHKALRGELIEFDEQLPHYNNTLTPPASADGVDVTQVSTHTTSTSEPRTLKSKICKFKIQNTHNLPLFDIGSTASAIKPAPLAYISSRKRAYPAVFNMNDEAKRIIETREAREKEFPVKVAIFPGRYHDGQEAYFITPTEKENIGRCIDKGLEKLRESVARKKVSMKVIINDAIRLAAGMAIVDCKDEHSAKWVIQAVNHIKNMQGANLRQDIDLK